VGGGGGGGGGERRGFPLLMMSLGIIPKMPWQRILLSDPGVPRTFVENCRSLADSVGAPQ